MLATLPRAAPRAARRTLTTGSATRAPLAPPYEHAIRSSLAPPYSQQIPAADARLQPAYAYQVRAAQRVPAPTPAEWVAGVLQTDAGRAWAQSAWESAVAELAEQPAKTPEIPFQALTAVLADPSMLALLQRSGSVVVRDVVRDALAEAWAAELIAVRDSRTPPYATFHHDAQVAARADCSVLSAMGQLLRALTGASESFVRIDAVTPSPARSGWSGKALWDVGAASGATPLHAHLALARTELSLPTSSAAATYALLRPHFTAKASRISFYAGADYLAPANWTLREGAADHSAELNHVRPATAALAPGDVLVSHAGLPLAAADTAGLVLPVHPLPATDANRAFVALQRAAFEAGLPPPHVDAELVRLEPAGSVQCIESYAGRRAMGYEA